MILFFFSPFKNFDNQTLKLKNNFPSNIIKPFMIETIKFQLFKKYSTQLSILVDIDTVIIIELFNAS